MKQTLRDAVPSNLTRSYVLGASPSSVALGRVDWRRVWAATQARPWRALAIVPCDDRIPSLDIATSLVRVGRAAGESVFVADLMRAPHYAGAFLDVVAYHVSRGDRLVLPTRSPGHDLSLAIARGADCAILCATLGVSSLRTMEEAVREIGEERFVGSLLVRPQPDDDPVVTSISSWGKFFRGRW